MYKVIEKSPQEMSGDELCEQLIRAHAYHFDNDPAVIDWLCLSMEYERRTGMIIDAANYSMLCLMMLEISNPL